MVVSTTYKKHAKSDLHVNSKIICPSNRLLQGAMAHGPLSNPNRWLSLLFMFTSSILVSRVSCAYIPRQSLDTPSITPNPSFPASWPHLPIDHELSLHRLLFIGQAHLVKVERNEMISWFEDLAKNLQKDRLPRDYAPVGARVRHLYHFEASGDWAWVEVGIKVTSQLLTNGARVDAIVESIDYLSGMTRRYGSAALEGIVWGAKGRLGWTPPHHHIYVQLDTVHPGAGRLMLPSEGRNGSNVAFEVDQ